MSEVMLNIVDRDQSIHGQIHGAMAERVVAALAADPTSIGELKQAVGRYLKQDDNAENFPSSLLETFEQGILLEPWDAGIVAIDLTAQLVASRNSYFTPRKEGVVDWHDGEEATEIEIPFCLDKDWAFSTEVCDWQATTVRRRRERGQASPTVRKVLYDELAKFVVEQVNQAEGERHTSIRDIHARWLTTPRTDLNGRTPREAMLSGLEHIDRDIEHQAVRWSRVGDCPPGLRRDSNAFQCGGFGTHEAVIYYDLVRYLLNVCWDRVKPVDRHDGDAEFGSAKRAALLVDLLAEVSALQKLQQEWLHWPQHPDFNGRTPALIIATERARLPLAVFGEEAMIDPDCPCCQAMVADGQPVFIGFDGYHMDDDFAFSLHPTREAWEREQQEWEEYDRALQQKDCKR